MVINPSQEYLGWVLPALCTATGHYLSVHKANLAAPSGEFKFLGFWFDCARQELSIPDSRKEKIRTAIQDILSRPFCDFAALEKLRGMLCAVIEVCPYSCLYIREMTASLVHGMEVLNPFIMLTPALIGKPLLYHVNYNIARNNPLLKKKLPNGI